ncbi:hypothetical protein UlMin_019123 [Ulmus minor]
MSKSSKVVTCKAVVCWGLREPGKVEEIQVEPPKPSEVRVKMLYASVCHTDSVLCNEGFPIPLFPRVLGHEGVGMVESIGKEVRGLKEGDVVIPTYVSECTNMCLTYPHYVTGLMLDGTSRMSVKGQPLYHVFSCSTWSEYMVVDVNYVLKIDPALSLRHASFLSCGFSTGFGAPWKEAGVEKGSSVAVIGLGAVGLGAIEGSRTQGATKIIGIDINEGKKVKGEAFGMTDFINPLQPESEGANKSVSELIKELTGGMGVDYCFECSGVPSLISEALDATKLVCSVALLLLVFIFLKFGVREDCTCNTLMLSSLLFVQGKGKAVIIGFANVTSVQINLLTLLCGRTLKGSVFGGLRPKADLPLLIEKCKNKEIKLDELLTHEVALLDIDKAFQLSEQQDCIKVLIKI